MPESRDCKAAGFLFAVGRFVGGCGGVGLPRAAEPLPFWAGGGGGARGAGAGAAGAGAGALISST